MYVHTDNVIPVFNHHFTFVVVGFDQSFLWIECRSERLIASFILISKLPNHREYRNEHDSTAHGQICESFGSENVQQNTHPCQFRVGVLHLIHDVVSLQTSAAALHDL